MPLNRGINSHSSRVYTSVSRAFHSRPTFADWLSCSQLCLRVKFVDQADPNLQHPLSHSCGPHFFHVLYFCNYLCPNKVLIALAFAAESWNDLSVFRHGPFGHHPGHVETITSVMLRFLLPERNAKSGCAAASITLAPEGNAYIPGRIPPPLGTRL